MKDRVPTYPGRIKLTAVSGETDVYDLERADEPTQAGTALNKSTLLTDETAERLGGDDTMTPDDAINAVIEESAFAVGDVISGGEFLNDSWILCDGSVIDEDEYPELYALYPFSGEESFETVPDGGGTMDSSYYQPYNDAQIYDVNGYYVCFQKAYLYYRLKTDSTWHYTSWDGIRSMFTIYSSRWGFYGIVYDEDNDVYGVGVTISRGTSSGYYIHYIFIISDLSDAPSTYITVSTNGAVMSKYTFLKRMGNSYVVFNGAYTYYCNSLNGTWSQYLGSTVRLYYLGDRYVKIGCTSGTESSTTYYYATVWVSERNPSTLDSATFTKFTATDLKYTNENGSFMTVGVLENIEVLLCDCYLPIGHMQIDLSDDTPSLIAEVSGSRALCQTSGTHMGTAVEIDGFLYGPSYSATYSGYVLRDNTKIGIDNALAMKTTFNTSTNGNLMKMTSDGLHKNGSTIYKYIKTVPTIINTDGTFCKIKATGIVPE